MNTPKILVLYYSRTDHTRLLAEHIANGVQSAGATAQLRCVPSVSPKTEAVESDIPDHGDLYVSKTDIENCDGLILGSPTRFGNMAAPLKHFIDTTGDLWLQGSLVGKPAAVFTSTSSMHGGQESTLLSMMLPLLHHGALIVGVPYTVGALSQTTTGGSPYGASHVSGSQNEQSLSDDEIAIAQALGKRVATTAKQLL